MAQIKQKSTWQKVRKLFNDIHLWLGLASGLIIVAVCFSGTVYVYNTEITEMATPHLYKVKVPEGGTRLAPDAVIEKVKEVSGANIVSVRIPADPSRTYTYVTKKEGDKSRFGTSYMVNPYSGAIVGNSTEKNGAKDFMSTMFSLHRWLLLDKVEKPVIDGMENRKLGSAITGWATIIFTLGCITGMVIWFPQKVKNWRQGLKIKMSGNWKRTNHDLHNSLAFYALIFLLVMGLTGPQWSFDWYRTGLQKTLGTYKAPAPKPEGKEEKGGREGRQEGGNPAKATASLDEGTKVADRKERRNSVNKEVETNVIANTADSAMVSQQEATLSIQDYLFAADQVLSYKGDYNITLPADAKASITINKTRVGFFAPAAGDRIVLKQQDASVVSKDIFRDKPFNERVAGSIKALHVGNVFGGFTKLLYFFACLIATSLPITGTLIWINKLKKKRKKKQGKKTTAILEPTLIN